MKAKQFKQIRKALGLTHVTMAKAIGRSPRSISYYENGEVIPDIVAAVMKALEAGHKAKQEQAK